MDEINFELIKNNFTKRKKYSHKGMFGTLALICGSRSMPGAPVMAASAALKCGVGKINICLPKSIYNVVATHFYEPIYTILNETKDGTLSHLCVDFLLDAILDSTACVVGCGLSNNEDIKKVIFKLLKNYDKPILIDADGINAISDNINVLKATKAKVILTPHPKELAKMLKVDVKYINNNRETVARNFAVENNVILVLKGANTLVAKEDGKVFKNTTGNPGMARAGMGDVLAGMIGSFLASGMSPLNAALSGVFLHGLAGDICAKKFSEISMSTKNLINELPSLFLKFYS